MTQVPIQHTVYVFNGFQLDVTRRKLLSGGGLVLPLNSRAMDALLLLLANAGEVVEKRRLLDAIWPDTVVEENNLNQCIAAIRKALGEVAGTNRFVLTVPGRGYAFVCPVRRSVQESDALTTTIATRRATVALWGAAGLTATLLVMLLLRAPRDHAQDKVEGAPLMGLQLEDAEAARSLLADCLASRPDLKLRVVVELVGNDAAAPPVWSGRFNARSPEFPDGKAGNRTNAEGCRRLLTVAAP